jgi:hypothetical protein
MRCASGFGRFAGRKDGKDGNDRKVVRLRYGASARTSACRSSNETAAGAVFPTAVQFRSGR